MTSRWDALFETKPIPLVEHLLEEVSKLLAKDLQKWPLPLQELDPEVATSNLPLMTGELPRPSHEVFQEAFRLAAWDLEHEVEAYDDYMRNRRWSAANLTAQDKPALLFISRWLLDQMTSLREATENRVKGKDLRSLLERTRKRLQLGA